MSKLICDDLQKFKDLPLQQKIDDLLLHYQRGHDGFYVEKANAFKQEMALVVQTLEFYSVGWVQKRARLDEYKVPRDVYKNPAVFDDHGRRATACLELFERPQSPFTKEKP